MKALTILSPNKAQSEADGATRDLLCLLLKLTQCKQHTVSRALPATPEPVPLYTWLCLKYWEREVKGMFIKYLLCAQYFGGTSLIQTQFCSPSTQSSLETLKPAWNSHVLLTVHLSQKSMGGGTQQPQGSHKRGLQKSRNGYCVEKKKKKRTRNKKNSLNQRLTPGPLCRCWFIPWCVYFSTDIPVASSGLKA